MRILVTGNAGFIGSHLSERLSALGHSVYGIDNFSANYDRSYKEKNAASVKRGGGEIIEADLAKDDLSKIVDPETEYIFHCAAQPGLSATTSFEDYVNNNVIATGRLVTATQALKGLKMFVHISTSSVYGKKSVGAEDAVPEPISYYGVTKLAGEQFVLSYAREGKLPACSIRPFSIYGERERPEKMCFKMIESILDGTKFPLFDGSLQHHRSFTYVGDLVDGLVSIIGNESKCNGQIFNMGNPDSVQVSEVVSIIEKDMGKKVAFDIKPKRAGEQLETKAKIDLAKRMLGFAPHTSIDGGLKRQIAWQEGLRNSR